MKTLYTSTHTSIHTSTHASIRARAGRGLVEVLLALLLFSLLAATLMSGVMEKRAELEAVASGDVEPGTQDIAGILALWTADPESLEGVELKEVEFDGEVDQQEYQKLLGRLQKSGRLDDWQNLLQDHVEPDHPMLVALEPAEDEVGSENRSGIRWADEGAEADDLENDPDVRWVR